MNTIRRHHVVTKSARQNLGFTMVEMLSAIVMLIALLSVIAVNVVSAQKVLRQKELDSKAETIYVAAQNELIKMRSGGMSSRYNVDSEYGNKSSYGTKNNPGTVGSKVVPLPDTPNDRDVEMDASGKVTSSPLFFMTKSDWSASGSTAASLVMRSNTVDEGLLGSNWVIEFDPASGSVYAVLLQRGDGPCGLRV